MDINNKHTWSSKSNRILEYASTLEKYNLWLVSFFRPYLKGRVLEVGAGLGGLSKILPKKSLILSDNNPAYIEHLKEEIGVDTLHLNIEKNAPKQYHGYFDAILSSNVFEHIKDDDQAFINCFKLLSNEGYLLLFVPAGPEIYGSLDRDMGHFRRYKLNDIKRKANKVGFKIIEIRYVNLPGYFAWWGRGVFPAQSAANGVLAKIFDLFVTPFLYLEKYVNPPIGQSIILVAQKT